MECGRVKRHSIEVLVHQELTEAVLDGFRQPFDSEYLKEFGEWDPQQPYGYASHDVHLMARIEGRIVGHVGWARREIAVGTETLAIAGVGGVFFSADARWKGRGRELMGWAVQWMRDRGRVACDYLGCREQVVPFYESSGRKKILARVRSIGRDSEPVVDEPGPPIVILPIAPLELWPEGDIDLSGRAW
ncbi:GNAT family N-acetyltransferase [Brevibacterium atlanticum]|uniref:GNAT family N-acetyltransferase n=1 Tax=Brevibacterium atlanticum TaxID=2697563 RepID=UPI00141F035A|nr:GNAT family N-acetyltransferase [Brevibacterium atlanticum]